jgi:hypothetical protein
MGKGLGQAEQEEVMRKEIILVLVWILCGVTTFGLMQGTFTEKFPWCSHYVSSAIMGTLGPIGLIGTIVAIPVCHQKYTFRFIPMTKAERWKAHHDRWPTLPYERFEETD